MKFRIEMRGMPQNAAWKIAARGGHAMMYTSKKYKEWKEEFQKEVKQIMYTNKYKKTDSEIDINIKFEYKTKRKVDVDAGIKALFDSLEGIVFENDFQIQKMTVEKNIGTDANFIEFTITEVC